MIERIPKKIRYTKRWFAYFDLLGFAQRVRTSKIQEVLPVYETVLETIEQKADPKKFKGLSYSWFSDTFILFTRGGSLEEFSIIEQASRLFFQRLVLKNIPLRGSITFGDLYTQQEKNIFLGEALMDAYEYGEKQNWINMVITPSAYEELQALEFPMERSAHYAPVTEDGIIKHQIKENVFAYLFNNGTVNLVNPFIKPLNEMHDLAPKKEKIKYENVLKFIEKHAREKP